MIFIENKRSKIENLKKKHPNAYIMDMTSKAREPYVKFSPFYPHGNIPIPFTENVFGQSVEGIWQGLKVFESEGIDPSKFENATMKRLKRTVKTYGKVLGHQKGVHAKELLGYLDARLHIYLPTYRYVLDNNLSELVIKLKQAHAEKDLVFLDYESNCVIGNLSQPLSHAYLIKCHIENKYPEERNYLSIDNIFIADTALEKPSRKSQKKAIQTKLTL